MHGAEKALSKQDMMKALMCFMYELAPPVWQRLVRCSTLNPDSPWAEFHRPSRLVVDRGIAEIQAFPLLALCAECSGQTRRGHTADTARLVCDVTSAGCRTHGAQALPLAGCACDGAHGSAWMRQRPTLHRAVPLCAF